MNCSAARRKAAVTSTAPERPAWPTRAWSTSASMRGWPIGPANFALTAHAVRREYQIVNTESLCNVELPIGKRLTSLGRPLNIRKRTGSPVRAIAILND